ncbi:hypothetical protein ACFXPY_13810 [Streptomyces sp. NPDC059153]|uniref:hypothetical protein n=1 Tax=Streptomyces sp. NPDC059153 TaxID=3346743 RepID=UPI0036B306AA
MGYGQAPYYDSVWGSASTQVKFDEILKKAEREAPYAYTGDGRDDFPAIPDSWNRCASGYGNPSKRPETGLSMSVARRNPRTGNGIDFGLREYVDVARAKEILEWGRDTDVACRGGNAV